VLAPPQSALDGRPACFTLEPFYRRPEKCSSPLRVLIVLSSGHVHNPGGGQVRPASPGGAAVTEPCDRYVTLPSSDGPTAVRFAGPTLVWSLEDPEVVADELFRLTEAAGWEVLSLDLARVEFMNAATLQMLVALRQRLGAAGRRLCLRNVRPLVAEV